MALTMSFLRSPPNALPNDLRGPSTSFHDLVGLLFNIFQSLESLGLYWVSLAEGHSKDVVEGLSQLRELRHCDFGEAPISDLYPRVGEIETISDLSGMCEGTDS